MKKRQSSTPLEQTETPATEASHEETSTEETVETSGGLKWLKYAGIGPARTRQGNKDKGSQEKTSGGRKKLSGEDITSLGSLEAELMSILWDINAPATSMDVMEQSLYKRRSQGLEPASFATIATTLRRLTDKGVVSMHKNAHGTPVYTPTVQREEMAARILNNVSETLLGQSLHGLLPRLLGTLTPGRGKGKTADTGEQAEVERLMQALEEAAGKGQQSPPDEAGTTKENSAKTD